MKVLIFTQFWYRKKPCCISKISKYDILDSTRNGRSSWMICPCIWVLLNRSPSSTQLLPVHFNSHPARSTSTPLISVSTQLSATPSILLEPKYRTWAISPNLGRKIQTCPFWLEIDTLGILEVGTPNPNLDFWNSKPKINFWANLGRKSQSCSFCLKIRTHGFSRMLIFIVTLVFWISNLKSIFGQIWAEKVKVKALCFNCKLEHRERQRDTLRETQTQREILEDAKLNL